MRDRLAAIAGGAEHFKRLGDKLRIIARPILRGAVDMAGDDWMALVAWVREQGIEVVVIDALSRIHTTDENSAKEIAQVLARVDALRHETGVAVVLLHHERKGQNGGRGRSDEDDLDALRGSSRLQSDPTALIRLVRLNSGLRVLRFVGVNAAAEPEPIYLKLDPEGRGFVTTAAPEKVGEANANKVLAWLDKMGAPQTREQIASVTKLSSSTVRTHLKAARDSGQVKVLPPERGERAPRYVHRNHAPEDGTEIEVAE